MMVGIPYVIYNYLTLHSLNRTIIDSSVLIVTTCTVWWLGKQYDKAKYYSEKDYLTGLYNRRFIEETLPKLLSLADKKNEKLSITILDCNNFKLINDVYGHRTGDFVLKSISTILQNTPKNSKIIARWGGDEFIIISPNTDHSGTKLMIEHIEKELEKLSQQTEKNISVSAGTAIYPDDSCDIENLIKIADNNMYRLKNR
ncbi:GGDEF domain-containing protein [Neobacillus sp. LXY-4]|uniref:GGDEF domain-containing protein n=1 Tax=Neobacillus sp. LXY-4 TaxID=3379826 RepID=UPI003EDEBE0C